jgi:hypothetical protein
MIDDEVYRSEYRRELAGLDLKKVLFNDTGGYFLKAVDYMLENKLERGNPILIGELNDEAK